MHILFMVTTSVFKRMVIKTQSPRRLKLFLWLFKQSFQIHAWWQNPIKFIYFKIQKQLHTSSPILVVIFEIKIIKIAWNWHFARVIILDLFNLSGRQMYGFLKKNWNCIYRTTVSIHKYMSYVDWKKKSFVCCFSPCTCFISDIGRIWILHGLVLKPPYLHGMSDGVSVGQNFSHVFGSQYISQSGCCQQSCRVVSVFNITDRHGRVENSTVDDCVDGNSHRVFGQDL